MNCKNEISAYQMGITALGLIHETLFMTNPTLSQCNDWLLRATDVMNWIHTTTDEHRLSEFTSGFVDDDDIYDEIKVFFSGEDLKYNHIVEIFYTELTANDIYIVLVQRMTNISWELSRLSITELEHKVLFTPELFKHLTLRDYVYNGCITNITRKYIKIRETDRNSMFNFETYRDKALSWCSIIDILSHNTTACVEGIDLSCDNVNLNKIHFESSVNGVAISLLENIQQYDLAPDLVDERLIMSYIREIARLMTKPSGSLPIDDIDTADSNLRRAVAYIIFMNRELCTASVIYRVIATVAGLHIADGRDTALLLDKIAEKSLTVTDTDNMRESHLCEHIQQYFNIIADAAHVARFNMKPLFETFFENWNKY